MSRRLVSLVAALALVGGSVLAQSPQSSPLDSSVTTTGEATIDVAPDVAFVQIAAEARAKKTADAQKQSADAMTSLQAALKALALPAAAIRTTGYTLNAEYDYYAGGQTFRDFLARNTIEVRVDDLTKLPEVIDIAGSAGGTNVAGLRFDVKERASIERDLLRKAVEDAMSRADILAAGAHRRLGTGMRITEQRVFNSPMYRGLEQGFAGGGGRGGSTPTPISAGEIQVRAQVTLTVAIQ